MNKQEQIERLWDFIYDSLSDAEVEIPNKAYITDILSQAIIETGFHLIPGEKDLTPNKVGAKDTVIKLDNFGDFGGISEYYLAVIKENSELQAEVSFKAGEQEGIRKGRNEVVELLYSISQPEYTMIPENKELWQKQLKEWGIK